MTTPTIDPILDRAIDVMLDELLEVGQVLTEMEEREEEDCERFDGMS